MWSVLLLLWMGVAVSDLFVGASSPKGVRSVFLFSYLPFLGQCLRAYSEITLYPVWKAFREMPASATCSRSQPAADHSMLLHAVVCPATLSVLALPA